MAALSPCPLAAANSASRVRMSAGLRCDRTDWNVRLRSGTKFALTCHVRKNKICRVVEASARNPVVVVDNYDSFTYNLCQYLGDLGCEYVVFRNDEISVDDLEKMEPRGILISPGPGTPDDSGISLEVVRRLGPKFPLFGVCMGLQCMGQAYGGKIVRAPGGVMHGKTSEVFHNQIEGDGLLGGLPSPFIACRYHSLVIERESFPEGMEVTAWTADGLVMGVRHKKYRHVEGVQFHPESIITQNGKKIVANFVRGLEKIEEQKENREKESTVDKTKIPSS